MAISGSRASPGSLALEAQLDASGIAGARESSRDSQQGAGRQFANWVLGYANVSHANAGSECYTFGLPPRCYRAFGPECSFGLLRPVQLCLLRPLREKSPFELEDEERRAVQSPEEDDFSILPSDADPRKIEADLLHKALTLLL
eukprot:s441_g17.t1